MRVYAEDAEMSLLGSMYIRSQVIGQVLQVVPGETMFFAPFHRHIFSAMVSLYREGHPVDLVTLKDRLESRGVLETVGGEDYLIQLGEAVPSAANAMHYANLVRERWAERTIIGRLEAILGEYNTGERSFAKLFKDASEVTRGRLMPSQFAFDVGQDLELEDTFIEGLLTGLPGIDDLTSMRGIPKGQLTTIGAYSGRGKSLLCQQIARNVAASGGRVAYLCFGGDLDHTFLSVRYVKQASGIFPSPNLDSGGLDIVSREIENLRKLPITIYEAEKAVDETMETALEWVETQHRSNPFALVIADYAQVMQTRERTRGPVEECEVIAKRMGSFSKRIGCGVVLASQTVDEESTSFRYSQQFIHSSGLAVIFKRDGVELMDGTYDVTATVVKNRWGYEGGTVSGKWNPKYTIFEF